MEYFPDHGAATGNRDKAQSFLYKHPFITFAIFIIVIVMANYIFETTHQIVREVTGRDEPHSYQMFAATLIFVIIFILLVLIIYRLPVASSFTY